MRILVTGGAGFIGSHFVDRMLTRSDVEDLIVLDSLTYAGNLKNLQIKDPRFSFVYGNICDKEMVNQLCQKVDFIVNFAAESHVDKSISNSAQFVETNVIGTHNLLSASLKFNLKRFIQISTDEVYGSIKEGAFDENAPLLPNSPYSASKASADLLVRSFHQTYGLVVNITRCTNNFGSRQYPEKIIPVFLEQIMNREKLPIYGNGLNVRDWIHVSDHCKAIELVLDKGKSGEIYNIGGGEEITNLELAERLLTQFNLSFEHIEFVDDRLGHDFRYSVNWSKIERELGFHPQNSFEANLRDTTDWYLRNPDWWVS